MSKKMCKTMAAKIWRKLSQIKIKTSAKKMFPSHLQLCKLKSATKTT